VPLALQQHWLLCCLRWNSEKLNARRDNLCALALAAAVALGFELAGAESTLDVNLPSLLQIQIAGFGQFSERDDMMPLDASLLLALLVGE